MPRKEGEKLLTWMLRSSSQLRQLNPLAIKPTVPRLITTPETTSAVQSFASIRSSSSAHSLSPVTTFSHGKGRMGNAILGGVMLFTSAAATLTDQARADSEAHPALRQMLSHFYPDCHQEMLSVYEAYGLIPLLNIDLAEINSDNPTPEELEKAQELLNKRLQAILLRPKDMERYHLTDKNYLALVEKRLAEAYQAAGLSSVPVLDPTALKRVLAEPNLWEVRLPEPVPAVQAMLFLGSTYTNFSTRLHVGLSAISSGKVPVTLQPDGSLLVGLLGGTRALDSETEGPIMDRLRAEGRDLDEQPMMDLMWRDAMEKWSGIPFKPFSTDSAKEEGGKRATTAGTVVSAIPQLKAHGVSTVAFATTFPFARYQHAVLTRLCLKNGLESMTLLPLASSFADAMRENPQLSKTAFIAITSDTAARIVFEGTLLAQLKRELGLTRPTPAHPKPRPF